MRTKILIIEILIQRKRDRRIVPCSIVGGVGKRRLIDAVISGGKQGLAVKDRIREVLKDAAMGALTLGLLDDRDLGLDRRKALFAFKADVALGFLQASMGKLATLNDDLSARATDLKAVSTRIFAR